MKSESEFVEMISSHEGTIYKIILTYTRDKNEIKDLYQEVVYQLWKSFSNFKGRSSINTWLYRVSLNTILTHQSKENKRRSKIHEFSKIDLNYNYDHELDIRIQLLYNAIHSLNKIDRAIILLHLEGCSYAEIAEVIGITTTNVGTKISRIKSRLSSLLKNPSQ